MAAQAPVPKSRRGHALPLPHGPAPVRILVVADGPERAKLAIAAAPPPKGPVDVSITSTDAWSIGRLDAHGQAALVARGEIAPAELIEAAILRIEEGEGPLHSVSMLLSPVTRHLPLPLGALAPTRQFDELWNAFFDQASCTPIQNITGQPSISLPLGWTDAGLPISVMVSAAVGGDDLLLALSAEIEEARPWSDRRPPGFASRLVADVAAEALRA
jgi:hypothetical protein